jgi:hypothetical protein
MMYKIGLVYKRHDIYVAEIKKQIKDGKDTQFSKVKTELDLITEAMQVVHTDLEEHTSKQRLFRQEIVSNLNK